MSWYQLSAILFLGRDTLAGKEVYSLGLSVDLKPSSVQEFGATAKASSLLSSDSGDL